MEDIRIRGALPHTEFNALRRIVPSTSDQLFGRYSKLRSKDRGKDPATRIHAE